MPLALIGVAAAVLATWYANRSGGTAPTSATYPNPAGSGVTAPVSGTAVPYGNSVQGVTYPVAGSSTLTNPPVILANPYNTNPGGAQPNSAYQTYNMVPGSNVSLVPAVSPSASSSGCGGACSTEGSGCCGNCASNGAMFGDGTGAVQTASNTSRWIGRQAGTWLPPVIAAVDSYQKNTPVPGIPTVASSQLQNGML